MLLRARHLSHHRWRRHRLGPHVNLSHIPFAVINSSSDDDFLPWLRRKSGAEISTALSIGKSTNGRALFASRSIEAGECVLKCPYSVQLSPENLAPEWRYFIGDRVGDVAKLAVVILCEQKLGMESEWDPYISRLPRHDEMHNTETIDHRSFVVKEYEEIRTAFERFPETFGSITCEDFKRAYTLVTSRAWGSKKGYSLIPFADFLNHDGTSEAVVLSDDDKHLSEVIDHQNYAQSEQVLIRYGKFSNATLMLDVGFTLPYNIHDQVQIQLLVPQHDILGPLKLELLKKHHRPIKNDVNVFKSSVDCFTIKEVTPGNGKGRGIPVTACVCSCPMLYISCEELNDLLNEAVEHDGRLARRPLTNRSREIEAHQMLMKKLTQLTEDCEASFKSLEHVSSPTPCDRLSLRTQMAHDLLNGELRILKSACAWLKHYCTALTVTDCHR